MFFDSFMQYAGCGLAICLEVVFSMDYGLDRFMQYAGCGFKVFWWWRALFFTGCELCLYLKGFGNIISVASLMAQV